jgi:hypothetical protein
MKKILKKIAVLGLIVGAVAFAPKIKIELVEDAASACPAGVVDC